MELSHDLSHQLLDFRTSYLRAVARAALDFDFRNRLTRTPNALKILNHYFDYKCPWDLTLVIKDDPKLGPRVNVANGTVMTQPFLGETITLYIPDKPKDVDSTVVMDALAAYYDMIAFLLPPRTSHDDHLDAAPDATLPEPPRAGMSGPKHPVHTRWFSPDMLHSPSARFDLGVAVDSFISFAACMFNTVALTWNNAHFKYLLTDEKSKEPAIGLLHTWLGYKYPWWMDLEIRIDPDARFEYRQPERVKRGSWKIKPPQVTLYLPWMTGSDHAEMETEVNKKDTHVAIMGLTLYNTDGAGYPFTCG